MEYLSKSTGKNVHIATVQKYISEQPAEVQWLLEAMAIKTLKIGATASTINKAFGEDFIPVFDIMLADKYVDVKKNKKTGEEKVVENWKRFEKKVVIATKKLDGNRNVVFAREDGTTTLYSREGHILDGCVEIEEAFKDFPRGYVYDGELLAVNDEGLNSHDLFKKTEKIIKKKGIKTGLEFHAFDVEAIENFEKGISTMDCIDRKRKVKEIVESMNHSLIKYVEPIYSGVFDKTIIDRLAEEAKVNEEEGIMVQLAHAPYQYKRTKDILKVKAFNSCDIRCVGVYEGKSGRNIGRLGGLVLLYKGHEVNVGGGFSDELRDAIWADKSMVLNKIVEIKYFEEFVGDDNSLDLRFATFKCIRDDKTEESYY